MSKIAGLREEDLPSDPEVRRMVLAVERRKMEKRRRRRSRDRRRFVEAVVVQTLGSVLTAAIVALVAGFIPGSSTVFPIAFRAGLITTATVLGLVVIAFVSYITTQGVIDRHYRTALNSDGVRYYVRGSQDSLPRRAPLATAGLFLLFLGAVSVVVSVGYAVLFPAVFALLA